jgi:hypothetical protein
MQRSDARFGAWWQDRQVRHHIPRDPARDMKGHGGTPAPAAGQQLPGAGDGTPAPLLAIGIAVTEIAVRGRRQHGAAARRAGYLEGISAAARAVATGVPRRR